MRGARLVRIKLVANVLTSNYCFILQLNHCVYSSALHSVAPPKIFIWGYSPMGLGTEVTLWGPWASPRS